MLFRFFPQEFKFFDLLEEQADYAVAAAVFFKEVVAKGEVTADYLSKMRDIEHRGDEAAAYDHRPAEPDVRHAVRPRGHLRPDEGTGRHHRHAVHDRPAIVRLQAARR